MPISKKKEPKFLSFISQNFSSTNMNKTNVKEKEPVCPINTLSQLLEPSSLAAAPKSNISLKTHKSKPSSSRQKHVDINNTADNLASGTNVMMNNTNVGSQKSVNVNQGSIINAPCKDSSGFAVPTMRAPRAQKNDTNIMLDDLKQKAMLAWCILDEDTCRKLFSILMIDCLNHIELFGQDNTSLSGMSDEVDSINLVKEWLNKLGKAPCSEMVSLNGPSEPGFRDIDNVSSVSGYNSIRQGPSHGNFNSSELRPGKLLLPRFMTMDPSIVGLPAFNPYRNQNAMMRSNASVAGFPEKTLSERAMSMRMDGSFMPERNCMDNASIYSARPYTPAYSHNNQFAYRGGASNHHQSNAYFSNRRLHSLMEDRENLPYNTENISYLDNTRRDQGFRLRDLQPRVMLDRIEYSDNPLFKVPAFSNTHGRTGSVQDFQRSYNHQPRYFDTSSSVRRNIEESEDMQEICSNAPVQSEYRNNDPFTIRRMNGVSEAVQENIGRPFETRSKDSTILRRINDDMQETIGRPFETRPKDSTIHRRINDDMQETIGRPFETRSKDSTMIRRVYNDTQQKIGSRLFENRSRDPSFLRRMNCDDSQKENAPYQSKYRLRDSTHQIRENNDIRTASSYRQIRDQAVEGMTCSRPAAGSAASPSTKFIFAKQTVQVHAPTPVAARTMNESNIVSITRSGRNVRAPQSFWAADMSYLSTANNQSIRGNKRKRVGN